MNKMHEQYTKSKTYQLIDRHLIPEINGIVWDYLVPDKSKEINSYIAGRYGLTEFITDYYDGLYNAGQYGYLEMANLIIDLGTPKLRWL